MLYSGFTLRNNKGIEDNLTFPHIENHPVFGMWGVDLVKALVKYRKDYSRFCVSLEDEMNCLKIAKDKILEIEKAYGSSLEEDVKLSKDKNISNNMVNILRVLIEEKKVDYH